LVLFGELMNCRTKSLKYVDRQAGIFPTTVLDDVGYVSMSGRSARTVKL